jgi:hypothetical protein
MSGARAGNGTVSTEAGQFAIPALRSLYSGAVSGCAAGKCRRARYSSVFRPCPTVDDLRYLLDQIYLKFQRR